MEIVEMESEIKTKDDVGCVDQNNVVSIAENENVIFVRLQFIDILGFPKNIVTVSYTHLTLPTN